MSGGGWTLYYDWNCTGSYASAPMLLIGDGTLNVNETETGEWVENDGKIMWRFDTGPAVYSGDILGSAMVGISSTFHGLNGCWYAVVGGGMAMTFEASKAEFDVKGNKVGPQG